MVREGVCLPVGLTRKFELREERKIILMDMGRHRTLHDRDAAWWDAQEIIAAQYGLRLRCRVRKPFPPHPLPELGHDI